MATELVSNGENISVNDRETPVLESIAQQNGPNRQEVAVGPHCTRWFYEKNVEVIECYFKSSLIGEDGKVRRGYRKRLYEMWRSRGYVESEQRICDRLERFGGMSG